MCLQKLWNEMLANLMYNVGFIRHGRGASAINGEATIQALAVHHHLLQILLDTCSERATPSF